MRSSTFADIFATVSSAPSIQHAATPEPIEITANRSGEEPWRLTRLAKVLERLDAETRCQLCAIDDCKGLLTVRWRKTPTTLALAAVVNAWRRQNEFASNHFVAATPLILDEPGYVVPLSS
jgi:hypothetical protein